MTGPADDPLRVIVIDDQEVVVEGTTTLLSEFQHYEIVGHGLTGEEGLRVASRTHPDLCLLDLRLPDVEGASLVRQLAEACPGLMTVLFTVYDDEMALMECLAAGARGFLSKTTSAEDLDRALRLVRSGKIVLDFPETVRSAISGGASAPEQHFRLSPRQRQILSHVALGRSNRDIAAALELSEQTVKNTLANAMQRLGAPNRTAAAMIARDRSLI